MACHNLSYPFLFSYDYQPKLLVSRFTPCSSKLFAFFSSTICKSKIKTKFYAFAESKCRQFRPPKNKYDLSCSNGEKIPWCLPCYLTQADVDDRWKFRSIGSNIQKKIGPWSTFLYNRFQTYILRQLAFLAS